MKKHPSDHPFWEVAANADRQIANGATIFQKWSCAHCGVRQQMPDENAFYMKGRCEKCGKVTDLEKQGCNFILIQTTDREGLMTIINDLKGEANEKD